MTLCVKVILGTEVAFTYPIAPHRPILLVLRLCRLPAGAGAGAGNRPAERFSVARVVGRAPQTADEVQTLLRKRLLLVAGMSVVVFAVLSPIFAAAVSDAFTLSLFALMVPLNAAVIALLRRLGPSTMRQLRL